MLEKKISFSVVPPIRHSLFITGLLTILLVFLQGCATLFPTPTKKPIPEERIKGVIFDTKAQNRKVVSFLRTGHISVRNGLWQRESNIFAAGTKDPFRIKIEITHSWGYPVFHILISGGKLEVLSFKEKRIYMGDFTPRSLSRLFPGELDPQLIWSILRGYPPLPPYHNAASSKGNQLSLMGENGKEVEKLELDPDTFLPRLAFFPQTGIQVGFSDYRKQGDIRYAKKIKIISLQNSRSLKLWEGKVIFNKNIPDEIFSIQKPPGFQKGVTPIFD
ncbi:MAG: hypothetical protein DRH11_14010 [Deltaproteobacteria bacterium]|nr:MAG: hypothetical protein DRH11_14010 [Deltaproteobacteria bacterium]